ncbi:MAG TPA: DUF262 domain-containing protein, partial [Thermoplasmata archaeon]|nr:DUF262 domain-containing protein [Thermoplasmata archaeon]
MIFSTISVRELVDRSVEGAFDIPEFQRDFVWRPDQVSALADSLCRDYPIGQLLAWEHADDEEARGPASAPLRKAWLVDGQQRATALCLVFGRKPYWWTRAEDWNHWIASTNVLANVLGTAPGVELGLSNPVRAADPRWVEVRSIVSLERPGSSSDAPDPLATIAEGILARLPPAVGARASVEGIRERLEAVWEIRARPLPIATVDREIEDVAEIFRRLNQQGTDIVESDVALATAASLRSSWVRDGFLPFLKNLSDLGYDLPTGVAVRALTAVGTGKVRLKEVQKEFWTSDEFDRAWEATRASLSFVVGGLIGAGALSASLLPSRNALIPLVALRARFSNDRFLFPRALHWFLLAMRDGRYGGSGTTTLSEDIRALRDSASFPEAVEALRGGLESGVRIEPAEFLDRWSWNRPLSLILYMALYDRKAHDLVTNRPLGHLASEGTPDVGHAPYLHPFFPKGRNGLRDPRFDYSEEEVNALANIVYLNEKPK